MTNPDAYSVPPSVRDQAIRWMVRLQSGDATSTDRDQLEAWLAEHPTHRQEFERLSHMWTTLDRAKPLLKTELDYTEAAWSHDRSKRVPESRLPLWQLSRLPITAGVLMALVTLTSWWWMTRPLEAILYQTAKGEQRQVVLADGSLVTLNTDTKIAVQISDKKRAVSLDRGEAWFTVSHDERRPFRVQAANGAVHDVGTQFIVNKSPQKVMVSVLEGIVEVRVLAARESPTAARPALLHQGEQIWYGADGRVSAIGSFNQSTVGAWREGKLIFQTQPLEHVLAEMARYRSEEIRVLDPGLKSIPVSGVFNIRDLQSFVQALQDALPIKATWVNPQLVLVERAPASPMKPKASTR